MSCTVLGSRETIARALATGLGAVICDLDAPLPSETDGVVIVVGIDPATEPSDTSTISATEWSRLAEEPMSRTLCALQCSRLSMRGRGGSIVLVAPTIGMAGAAGLVPFTTAAEGIRAMAKSAARQWASEGIQINTIAVPMHVFAPALRTSASHLTAAAVEDDDETLTKSVVETTKFLLRRDLKHIVGETIIVDGGSVMLP